MHSSRPGNDTDVVDGSEISTLIYDEELMADGTIDCCRVDQYPETCQVKSPMLDSSPDNQTTEYSKQSLESENILLKETVAQFQKDFSRMEAHCIALELKYQNQSLKSGQHGQILNETSNKAKIEKEIDVLETMNIELEHSVATLRKENETLKQHYKDLYDSIKITRSKTTEQTTSLLANNAELKAQIQEKVFAIAALKNDLRKLKGNSVDTKFDKTSVLGKPVLPSLRNQSVVRQPNAFKSARAQMSKQRFASQVDVNKNLSKPVTQHYLPKKTESTFAKPDHMIASSSSRNSSKNMPRFSSNDMVHNHYLDVAKKKIQERDRNSTTSVPTSARIQTTTDDRKPNPRSNNQTSRSLPVSKSSRVTITAVPKADHSKSSSSFSDSKNFVCSTCHKCVFNANHDACIIKILKEVNSRAKIQSNKTINSNKPVDQKSHTQKPGRQIFTGHRFSPNKTFAVYEKTSPRSDLRWKPTGRIFKSVGLRWIRTRKLFDSCTSKVDSEPPHGSNVDIPHIHECKQTLDVSAGTSINVQKEQSLDLSADHVSSDPGPQCSTTVLEQDSLSPGPQSQENVPQVAETVTTSNELDLLFGPLFDEYFNGENQVVLKSSAVTTTDASNKRQQPDSTSSTSTLATTVTANGNFDLNNPMIQPEPEDITQRHSYVIEIAVLRSYALSWKPCQGDSLNLPDHRAQVDQGSQIKMIQVKEMMQDNDLKNSKSKDKGSKSRSQSMDEQSHYKQDKTITRQSINVKRHIFNVIDDTEKFEERDLNIRGDYKERYNADIRATNILLQGLPKDIYTLINHYTDAIDIWDNVKMLLEGSELTKEDRESQLMQLNSKFVNNMLPEWGRFVTAVKLNRGLRDSNYDQLQGNNARDAGAVGYGGAQNRENRVALDEEQLLFTTGGQDNAVDEYVDEQPVQELALNVDNMFQADDYDAFDSDVDEAPTAQTMFMANLLSADPIYDEASPGDSNMILYDQYVKDNAVPVVQSNNNVVDKSLTAELATYKEQVELYERQTKFELTEREQKINEQLRIVITDRNIKEENYEKELLL
ncbi:hypothetical protein Tco_0174024 [Tanacetum coccineum]